MRLFFVLVGCFVASTALAGCGAVQFTLGYDAAEYRVAGNPLGGLLGPLSIPLPLDIDLAGETAARNTGPAQHVRLLAMTVSVTSTAEPAGDTDDLSFIDALDVFIEPREASAMLPRQRVAHLDPAPDGQRSFALDCEPVDLIEYVRAGARLTSEARGTLPPDDVTLTAHIELGVEVL